MLWNPETFINHKFRVKIKTTEYGVGIQIDSTNRTPTSSSFLGHNKFLVFSITILFLDHSAFHIWFVFALYHKYFFIVKFQSEFWQIYTLRMCPLIYVYHFVKVPLRLNLDNSNFTQNLIIILWRELKNNIIFYENNVY